MPTNTYMKVNFNGGEMSPLLDGRIDYPKYASGAKELTNFTPTVYGPITKRPGTGFVYSLPDKTAFHPFEFNETQAYVLMFSNLKLRFAFGDFMLDDGVGGVYEIAAPYTEAQLDGIRVAQSGDIAYVCHPEHPVYKLSRVGSNEFTLEEVMFKNGPFQRINTTDDTFTIQSVTGTAIGSIANFRASTQEQLDALSVGQYLKFEYNPAAKFDTWEAESSTYNGQPRAYSNGSHLTYEGRVYEVVSGGSAQTGTRPPMHEKGDESDGTLTLRYKGDKFGYIKVTAINAIGVDSTGEILKELPIGIVGNATDDWAYGSFYSGSYPSSLTFHQQRLLFGGTNNEPQTFWASTITDIEDFNEGTNDDDAYQFKLAAERKNPIQWMISNIDLQIGTLGSEFVASSRGGAITPTDVNIKRVSSYGSSSTFGAAVSNGFTLFIQQGGRKLRELRFDEGTQRNFARDLNKVAEHITSQGIKSLAVQNEPYQLVWAIVGGSLACLTYETDENVFAWHKHDISGEVVSIATVPFESQDRLWICVKRNIEGQDRYYAEFLTPFFERSNSLDDAVFLDSSLSYSGPPISNVTGLDHLEGLEVSALADGATDDVSYTVTGGQITLQSPASKITVGLPYKAAWQSMRLEGGSPDGVGQGKAKQIKSIIFRLDATGSGLKYGRGDYIAGQPAIAQNLYDVLPFVKTRSTSDRMDAPPPLIFGDTPDLGFTGGTSKEFFIRVEHDLPLPCTIIALIAQTETHMK